MKYGQLEIVLNDSYEENRSFLVYLLGKHVGHIEVTVGETAEGDIWCDADVFAIYKECGFKYEDVRDIMRTGLSMACKMAFEAEDAEKAKWSKLSFSDKCDITAAFIEQAESIIGQ